MTGTQHSKYPPSSAYRWLKCPASVLLPPDDIKEDTTAAEEGTLAHKIAELKLTADIWNDNEEELKECRENELYDPVMEKHTDNYIKQIEDLETATSKRFIETKLDMRSLMPGLFGTCDCILFDPVSNKLTIIDFKYGYGKVEVNNNPQLKLYALGAIEYIKEEFPDTDLGNLNVDMGIFQPRIKNIAFEPTTKKKLDDWFKKQEKAINKILDNQTERNTGSWCRYCDRQIHCRDYQELLMDCYIDDFFSLSEEEIVENYTKLQDIVKLLDKLKKHITSQIKNGEEVKGFKLQESNRKGWDDPEKVLAIALEYGLVTPMSPNQMSKKLGKELFEEMFGSHITLTPQNPRLIKEK